MRYGFCAGLAPFIKDTEGKSNPWAGLDYKEKIEKIPYILDILEQCGYDFIELEGGMLLAEALQEEFNPLIDKFKSSRLKPEVFSSLIPGYIKVVGDQVDPERVRKYINAALDRVKQLDGKIVVLGSADSRMIPEGFSKEDAWEQIKDLVYLMADKAEEHNLEIAIEPLSMAYSNLINTVDEGLALIKEINRREVKLMADVCHILDDGADLSCLQRVKQWLIHVHIADSDRLCPGEGEWDFREIFSRLESAGYGGRISVECNYTVFEEEAAQAIRVLKEKMVINSKITGALDGE